MNCSNVRERLGAECLLDSAPVFICPWPTYFVLCLCLSPLFVFPRWPFLASLRLKSDSFALGADTLERLHLFV